MNKSGCYFSTSCMSGHHLGDVLSHCEKRGILNVELSGAHPYEPIDKIRKLLLEYKKRGFSFTVHNYFPPQKEDFVLNIASQDDSILKKSRNLVEEALSLAEEIESPVYGIHAGYLADANVRPDGMFEFNLKKNNRLNCLQQMSGFITDIVKKLDGNRVPLILENLFPAEMGNYSLGCTFGDIKEIISLAPKKVGLLLDLGHVNVASNLLGFDKFKFLQEYLSAFGSRLYEVHLSENNGLKDEHLPLKKCSWQLEALRDICSIPARDNFSRIYCLESRNTDYFDDIEESISNIEHCINF